MSISRQPGSRVIRAFSDVEKSFTSTAKSENKLGFSTSEKARISSRVNKFYLHGRRGYSRFEETNDHDKTKTFFQEANSFHRIICFTAEVSNEEHVVFNTKSRLVGNETDVDLYMKHTDTHFKIPFILKVPPEPLQQ